HRGSWMVIVPGPYHREFRETRSSMAAVRVNGLNAEPACLPVPPSPVARFTWDFCQLLPPYMARTSPVAGSMATTAACGSPGVVRVVAGIEQAGVGDQAGQRGRADHVQRARVDPPVRLGRRLHAVRAVPEVDRVQVLGQDLVLGVGPLQLHRQEGLPDLLGE